MEKKVLWEKMHGEAVYDLKHSSRPPIRTSYTYPFYYYYYCNIAVFSTANNIHE